MLKGLLYPLHKLKEFTAVEQGLAQAVQQQMVYGLAGIQVAYVTAGLWQRENKGFLVLCNSSLEAVQMVERLSYLTPAEVQLFPAKEFLGSNIEAFSREAINQRLKALTAICAKPNSIIVAPIGALIQKLVPAQFFAQHLKVLRPGSRYDPQQLISDLVGMGYKREALVQSPGQIAVRGGIIDVFAANADFPVRLEFFDDELESVRQFDLDSQRSTERLEEMVVGPASEFLTPAGSIEKGLSRIQASFDKQHKRLQKLERDTSMLEETFLPKLELLAQGGIPDNLDSLLACFHEELSTLADYFPQGNIIMVEPARIKETYHIVEVEIQETLESLLERGQSLPLADQYLNTFPELVAGLTKDKSIVAFSLLPKNITYLKPQRIVNFAAKAPANYIGQQQLLVEDLKRWRQQQYSVVISVGAQERAENLLTTLRDAHLDGLFVEELGSDFAPGGLVVTVSPLDEGFELINGKVIVLTEKELFGSNKKPRKARPQRQGGKLASFADLNVGDYVVHVSHGIGRYEGVKNLEVKGVKKDYLLISYAGQDKLYVPTEQMDLIQKYLGAEGYKPKISKLGGTEWHKAKSKVREAVQAMAEDLVKLYAEREKLKGFAFGQDTVWQQEFEEAFPFQETPDQLRSIVDIKRDMQGIRPMDRLLCGDVGYGKTEVALRATFKAVMDSKQVAFLVPTTILAQQHYNTIVERFRDFEAVKVGLLSRFRSPKEQKKTVEELKNGRIDIVVGTHRLLQEDIKFKELGLVIVDEEQRFGVAHKERLKLLRKNVDVLTLSATPIPRTLHMALVGVRDMSMLETPPEERFPVQTYVLEWNGLVIREAIHREMARNGQVYVVHNRVHDIEQFASYVQSLVPEARIAIGHGQMKEDELERIMVDFMEGNYDVLLCTTIIETGLDIPNVNTLIIDEADHLGLSQLYQLRGRVGRSNRVAYAYLTYKKDKVLNVVAEKRLRAIKEFTEFGSGFKIAMRDLEIRGAGNLLGPEQHGFMASVGFDMYCRILEEAVNDVKGIKEPERQEISIDVPVDAFITDEYIPRQVEKMDFYRRISLSASVDDVFEIQEELEDRYGPMPEATENLLTIAVIRVKAMAVGVKELVYRNGEVVFTFVESPPIAGAQLVLLAEKIKGLSFVSGETLQLRLPVKKLTVEKVLMRVDKFLEELKGIGLA